VSSKEKARHDSSSAGRHVGILARENQQLRQENARIPALEQEIAQLRQENRRLRGIPDTVSIEQLPGHSPAAFRGQWRLGTFKEQKTYKGGYGWIYEVRSFRGSSGMGFRTCAHDKNPTETPLSGTGPQRTIFSDTESAAHPFFSIDVDEEGHTAIAGGAHKRVCFATRSTASANWETSHEVRAHNESVTRTRLTIDGRIGASTSADGTAKLWEISSGRVVLTFEEAGCSLNALDLGKRHVCRNMMITGDENRVIRQYDLESRRLVATFPSRGQGLVNFVHISETGNLLASGTKNEQNSFEPAHRDVVLIWDVRARCPVIRLNAAAKGVRGIQLIENRNFLAFCQDGANRVKIFDVRNGSGASTRLNEQQSQQQQPLQVLTGHRSWVNSVCAYVTSNGGIDISSGGGQSEVVHWGL
jgi:WD40 repeat protein